MLKKMTSSLTSPLFLLLWFAQAGDSSLPYTEYRWAGHWISRIEPIIFVSVFEEQTLPKEKRHTHCFCSLFEKLVWSILLKPFLFNPLETCFLNTLETFFLQSLRILSECMFDIRSQCISISLQSVRVTASHLERLAPCYQYKELPAYLGHALCLIWWSLPPFMLLLTWFSSLFNFCKVGEVVRGWRIGFSCEDGRQCCLLSLELIPPSW